MLGGIGKQSGGSVESDKHSWYHGLIQVILKLTHQKHWTRRQSLTFTTAWLTFKRVNPYSKISELNILHWVFSWVFSLNYK